ncbi:MAG: mRNA surveillance protein pelota [Thermoplasmatales archaeon]|nr:mRNA surveillance protein pelota [Thermoplasmatales archaeon]
MRVLHQDRKKGEIRLLMENLDDLWHMYNIVEKNDLVFALTHRKVEKKTDKLRPEKVERKTMRLGIRVTDVEFHEFSDRLRIHGVIENGTDVGSYHTLNLTVEDNVSILKEWKEHHLSRIKEAVEETKRPTLTFLSIDYDEATFALLRQYGVENIGSIASHISGKQYKTDKNEKNNFYSRILTMVEQIKKGPIVIVGPGFAKEEFYSFVKEKKPELLKDVAVMGTGNAGMNGIHEVLKKGVTKFVENTRVSVETKIVESLFEEIAKNGNSAYGFDEVKNALDTGAVETLLVTDKLVRTKKADELLEKAKKTSSKFMIISTVHESGKKLEGLGGVAALLRYKIS